MVENYICKNCGHISDHAYYSNFDPDTIYCANCDAIVEESLYLEPYREFVDKLIERTE